MIASALIIQDLTTASLGKESQGPSLALLHHLPEGWSETAGSAEASRKKSSTSSKAGGFQT